MRKVKEVLRLRSNGIVADDVHNRFFRSHLGTTRLASLQLPGESNRECAEDNRDNKILKR
jgi:hypothetical protein